MHSLHPLMQARHEDSSDAGEALAAGAAPHLNKADVLPAERPAHDGQHPLATLIEQALLTARRRSDAERAAQQAMVARNGFD